MIALDALKTRMASDPRTKDIPGLPTQTFAKDYVLTYGGVVVEAHSYGRGHTGDDTMIYFPDLKVVMVSDQITDATPIVDFANGGSAVEWTRILDGVLKLDFDMAIPGRGEPKTRADVEAYRNKFASLMSRASAAIKAGATRDTLAAQVKTDTWLAVQRGLLRQSLRRVASQVKTEEKLASRRLIIMRSAILGVLLFGQTVPAQVSFEVASVKLSAPGQNMGNLYQGGPGTADPTRFTATNVVLGGLLMRAFGVQRDQLTSPDWVNTVRVDIAATVPAGASKDQFNLMLQELLAERFHMTFHAGRKEFPAFNMTVAKNGSKLKPSDGKPGAGLRINASCAGDHMLASNRDSAGIAAALQNAVAARVIDHTGLSGAYDFDLYFGLDRSGGGGMVNCKDVPMDAPAPVEAVEKQLGLRLEKTVVMLDVYVIDSLDKAPSPN